MSSKDNNLGSVTVKGKYFNRNAEKIMRMLNSGTGILFEHHTLRALEEQGFHFDVHRDNKSKYDPDALYTLLGRYGRINPTTYHDHLYQDALALTYRAFGGSRDLEPLSDKEEFLDAIKQEKASGAPSFVSKGEAFEQDFIRMEKFSLGLRAAEPCIAYHRIQHGKDGPKTRLVWGYPLHMTLLEAKYARPLIKKFLRARTPMAFGLHRHELSARLVPIENAGIRYCFDFSGYDSSLKARLIHDAFKVLKTHFNDVYDVEWDRMVHYFIHTPILMPDGNVYVKHQGVPSGSYWTQLVDSIINFLANQYASLCIFGKPIENEKLLVLGDDGVCGIDGYAPISVWAGHFAALGLKLNMEKSEMTRNGDFFTFLGHTWQRGLVNRDIREVAKRMAFPERIIHVDDPRLRIVSRILQYGSDALNAHLIIHRWAHYKGTELYTIYVRDCLTEPLLGWREFVDGGRPSAAFPQSALDQSYIGILT